MNVNGRIFQKCDLLETEILSIKDDRTLIVLTWVDDDDDDDGGGDVASAVIRDRASLYRSEFVFENNLYANRT